MDIQRFNPKDSVLRGLSMVVVSAAAISGLSYFFLGVDTVARLPHLLPCPFKMIFGLSCPGCGMTRGILSLGQLNLIRAMNFNPFSIVIFWIIFFYAIKGRFPAIVLNKIFIKVFFGLVIIMWFFGLSNL